MKKNKPIIKNTLQILNPLEDAKDSASTTVKLMISALTLVSALAWNDAIKGIFELLKQNEVLKNTGFLAPFVYAIVVTIITIIIINRIQKLEEKLEKKKKLKKEE